jgi:hypothetical protein
MHHIYNKDELEVLILSLRATDFVCGTRAEVCTRLIKEFEKQYVSREYKLKDMEGI